MEMLIVRPEVFYKLYNCSYEMHKYNGPQHWLLSLTYLGIGIILLTFYIPCMMIMLRSDMLKFSCYKIMFFMAINDIPGVFLAGVLSGVLGFWNISFCHAPRLIYFAGCVAELTWHCQTSAAILLAFSRCTLMLHRRLAEDLFEGWKTWAWICALPLTYGLAAFIFAQPVVFSSEIMIWLFNPHFGYLPDVAGVYMGRFHAFNNIVIVVALPTVYIAFGVCYYFLSIRSKHASGSKSRSSLLIFYQIGCICLFTITLAALYLVANLVTYPVELYYFSQVLWILYSGSPSVIYLTMNNAFRRPFLDLFRTFRARNIEPTLMPPSVMPPSTVCSTGERF